jgi:excisionase family DNA binding protein
VPRSLILAGSRASVVDHTWPRHPFLPVIAKFRVAAAEQTGASYQQWNLGTGNLENQIPEFQVTPRCFGVTLFVTHVNDQYPFCATSFCRHGTARYFFVVGDLIFLIHRVNAQADVNREHRDMDESQNPIPDDLRAAIAIAVRDAIRNALQSGALPGQAFLTIREVTRVLNCSRTEVYRRIRAGDLSIIKRGRRTLFDAACVRTYADRLRAGGACK